MDKKDRKPKIRSAKKAVEVAKSLVTDFDKEYVVGLYLDAENMVRKAEVVGIGTLTATLVHPREVYKPAIRHSAAGLVLLHNHPTGGVKPSNEDIKVTKQMKKAGEILSIPLLDHIIFCRTNDYYSLKGNKKM